MRKPGDDEEHVDADEPAVEPEQPAWYSTTATTAIARRPSMSGRNPLVEVGAERPPGSGSCRS